MKLKLLALLMVLWASVAHAEVVNVPDQASWSASVANAVLVFEDPSGTLTLDDILALPEGERGFRQYDLLPADIGLTRSAIWLRLDVRNLSGHPQPMRLALGPFNFERQDSYLQRNGQWEKLAVGVHRRLPESSQASRMPTVPFVLKPVGHERIYVRLQSQTAFHLRPKLYTVPAYLTMESKTHLWDGILFGGLLAFAWGALMVAFFARSASFSLLGLLSLSVFLYEATLRSYSTLHRWPLIGQWGEVGTQFFGYLSYAIAILFCVHVAKAKNLAVPVRTLYTVALVAAMMAIGPFMLGAFAINQLAIYVTPLGALVLVAMALYLMTQMAPSRKLILLLTLFTLCIMLLRALDSRGHLASFNDAIGIGAIATNPAIALIALFINLTIVAGWIQHLAHQRKIGADKLLLWQEQEQKRLREEVARQTEALRQALQYANEKNQQKTEILSYIGHDLRAPLATISGYVDLLKASEDSRNCAPIQAIERSIDYQMTLIDELLQYAKTELKPPVLSPAPVYMKVFMDDLVPHARALAQKRNNRLHFKVSPILPDVLLLDSKRLQQVLLNLLANAAKFTDNGDIHLHVNAIQGPGTWTMRFAVSDTGGGIEDDQKALIFKAFEQARPQEPGIGLGLFIVQNIVREMGSRLELQSAPQRGSIFSFQVQLRCLNDNFVSWQPPLAGSLRDEREAAANGKADAAAAPTPPTVLGPATMPPTRNRMELAVMARDGQVSDIEDWLNEMRRKHPESRTYFDQVKSALYSLDMAKIETLALTDARNMGS